MADTEIEIPGVGHVAFPDSMTQDQINIAATRLYRNASVATGKTPAAPAMTDAPQGNAAPGSNTGLLMSTAGQAVPAAATGAMELATNPSVPAAMATAGRVAGAIAPVAKYGPVGLVGSAKGAWAGGKAGWFSGKLAQQAAAPVASALEKAAPYAQTMSTLGGAQGVNDLAQMAEPDRRDIGVLGVGPSAKAGAIPNADVLAAMPVEAAVKTLTDAGWPEARAKSYVTQMRKLFPAAQDQQAAQFQSSNEKDEAGNAIVRPDTREAVIRARTPMESIKDTLQNVYETAANSLPGKFADLAGISDLAGMARAFDEPPRQSMAIMMPPGGLKTRLFRAAEDDFVRAGTSFSQQLDAAREYKSTTGFGGSELHTTKISNASKVLDLTDNGWDTLRSIIKRRIDPSAHDFELGRALATDASIQEAIAKKGYDWVKFSEVHPSGSTTWMPMSENAVDEAYYGNHSIEDALRRMR